MCPTTQMTIIIHIINGYLLFKTILWNSLDEMVVPRKHAHPHLLHLWHGIRSFRPLGLGGEHREKFIRDGDGMYLTHQFCQTGGIMGKQHGQFLTGVFMQVVATATKVVYGIMKRTFYLLVLTCKSQSGKRAAEVNASMLCRFFQYKAENPIQLCVPDSDVLCRVPENLKYFAIVRQLQYLFIKFNDFRFGHIAGIAGRADVGNGLCGKCGNVRFRDANL